MEFVLSDGRKFVVRPSGTEPKLKAYLFARGITEDAGLRELDTLEAAVRTLCE